MDTHEKIRAMREQIQLSQEQMAEKMNMSQSGYAKIERGETRLHLEKLEQIAQIFNIDVLELVSDKDKTVSFAMNGTDYAQTGLNIYHYHNSNYYGNDVTAIEIDKLKLTLTHKEEIILQKDSIIKQKDDEISTLKEMISLLKNKK
ncbi:helix-turn-helix domain-containing protein [Conchiformibius steedae]|uniref:helix-turn-helix domain-containing protein n=1 Tax=Conchiformibius steedae TaxID=153493 RepID=UPI0026EB7F4E|nr:helix-turn-helix transcriptional regulator [Conchiformibius steedae]